MNTSLDAAGGPTPPVAHPPVPDVARRRRVARLGEAGRLAVRRLLWAVPVVAAVSVVVFLLGAASPFDPIYQYYGARIFTASAADVAQARQALGLNDPVWSQYADWIGGVVTGDWGISRAYRQPVVQVIVERLPWTQLLAGVGLALAAGLALLVGVFAAWRQGGWLDRIVTALANALEAVPAFLLGLGAIGVFALALQLAPAGGLSAPGDPLTAGGVARHLVLPAFVLAVSQLPWLILAVRQQLLVTLAEDNVTAARARSLSERRTVWRHALPGALLPYVTTLGGRLPEVVTGVVLVEEVFSWPGVARAMVQAGLQLDYPLLLALTLLATAAVLVGNLLADLAVLMLDPRVSSDG
ncbi:ABC transporter permease [Actinopolymorpha pittospori]